MGRLGRIAALLACARQVGETGQLATVVTEQDVQQALKFADYFIRHAAVAFDEMDVDNEVTRAEELLVYIKRFTCPEFSERDLLVAAKGRFKNMKAIRPARKMLEEYGYIRAAPQPRRNGPGRPPSQTYVRNPHWL